MGPKRWKLKFTCLLIGWGKTAACVIGLGKDSQENEKTASSKGGK